MAAMPLPRWPNFRLPMSARSPRISQGAARRRALRPRRVQRRPAWPYGRYRPTRTRRERYSTMRSESTASLGPAHAFRSRRTYRHLARALDARKGPVVAIDIPSGVDALTGAAGADAVRATVTVTLAAVKPGLLLEPAREYVGELWCGRIGIDDATLAAQPREFATLDDEAFLQLLPHRAPDTQKYAAGAPLIIAGSAQFPGAAVLCARGAARAGAGYVTVATPSAAQNLLRMHLVEQVVVELADEATPEAIAEELVEISKRNGAVAIGPGLGLDDRMGQIFTRFLTANQLPIVVDASGLFHLSKRLDLLAR